MLTVKGMIRTIAITTAILAADILKLQSMTLSNIDAKNFKVGSYSSSQRNDQTDCNYCRRPRRSRHLQDVRRRRRHQ